MSPSFYFNRPSGDIVKRNKGENEMEEILYDGKLPFRRHVVLHDGGKIEVTCPICGKSFSKELSGKEARTVREMYANGGFHPEGHVQDLFPDWSADDRELYLMTNVCPYCWEKTFDGGEEDGNG